MKRRVFIKNCCYSTIGLTVVGSLLQSCSSIHYVTAKSSGNVLSVPKSSFEIVTDEGVSLRDFIYVVSDGHSHPICLTRIENEQFFAALLKCTHKGCELNVGGTSYSCPCHGSEFALDGSVINGPAEDDLTTYRTEIKNDIIYIWLS